MRKLLLVFLSFLFVLPPPLSCADVIPQSYFETVAALAAQYGEYETWPLHAKQEWIQALHDSHTDPPVQRETAALLTSGQAEATQAQAIDDYLVNRYGVAGHLVTVNLYYCLTGELGPQYAWTLEQQAWVSQLYITYFPGQWDRMVYSVPDNTVIPPDKATAIAKAAIAEAYHLDGDSGLDAYTVSLQYGVHRRRAAEEAPYYTVLLGTVRDGSDPEMLPFGVYYACYVTGTGDVMDTSDSRYTPSPAEQYTEQYGDAGE